MDSKVQEEQKRLIALLRGLETHRASSGAPGFPSELFENIQKLSPQGLLHAISSGFPFEVRLAAARLMIAILLDTTFLERYGLVQALDTFPVMEYLPPLLHALQEKSQPPEIQRLGLVSLRMALYADCNTPACSLLRALSARTLLRNLQAFHEELHPLKNH
uniref:Uncharacterized protein n=1 Tax=Anaerolinea thermolimosa TaxID=229919 RepID=A0A7C4PH65_9CHLR